MQDQLPTGVRAPLPEDPVEVSAARQPRPAGLSPRAERVPHHTVSRVRPFARRRLRISRPPRVRIRARNPCVRARLRFFG